MGQYARAAHRADCRVCLMEHDTEIHDATLSLHKWLRQELMKKLDEDHDPAKRRAPAAADVT
ncbi:MAG: hypothetical protein LAP87_26615 [Acidobacteriia bacterium]|nr:hypothetical protein [Terriglobia bacterium]